MYPLRTSWWIPIALCCVVLVALGECTNHPSSLSTRNSKTHEPVVLKRGETIPKHYLSTEGEEFSLIEGLRTLGEWLAGAGFTGEEESPFVPTQPDASELHSIDLVENIATRTQQPLIRTTSSISGIGELDAHQSPFHADCNFRGMLVNKTSLVDKCKGDKCFISKMICEGQEYSGPTLYAYPGTMDKCQILSIKCNQPFQDRNFTNACAIQKFMCPNNEIKLPSELTGQNFEYCQVQTYCTSENGKEHRFYGFDAFDYECTNYRLICDGVEVEEPNNYQAPNGSCVIKPIPCAEVGSSASLMCNRIDSTCVTDPLENACSNRLDYTVQCPRTSPRVYATIEQITCGSETHDYNNWDGSIATCTSIRSIRQGQQVYPLPYNASANSYCILSELDCGGERRPWNFTRRIPEGCGVSRVICGNSPPFRWPPNVPSCTSYEFGCSMASTTCRYAETNFPCATRCRQPGMALQCDCPVDWKGVKCEALRALQCNFTVTNTTIATDWDGRETTSFRPYTWRENCYRSVPKRHLGDPICHTMKSKDALKIVGRLNCSFTDGPLPRLLERIQTNFNYSIYAEQFRLSDYTYSRDWLLYMKLLNYDKFTDLAGSESVNLTPAQMAGNDTVTFMLQPSAKEEQYKTGGRIRAEWQFPTQFRAPAAMVGRVMYGATFDIMDWTPNYPSKHYRFNAKALSLALLSIVGILIASLFIIRCIKKRSQNSKPA